MLFLIQQCGSHRKKYVELFLHFIYKIKKCVSGSVRRMSVLSMKKGTSKTFSILERISNDRFKLRNCL